MKLRLHDTAAGRKRLFEPLDPQRVRMYVCGPTVYDYAHIGNARPAVVFDLLFRLLRHIFGEAHVVYARNITDIDDKIIARAAETGEPIAHITGTYARIYRADMAALHVLPPTIEPQATGHIDDMIAMIARMIEKGCAYAAEGHVLFSVAQLPDYGALSHRSREEMIAGARVEVAPYKRDPADFVLWKPSTPDQPGWESPWGRGRPGWHLECSAMIAAHLGETIDIHGGGQDLVFPHHENERAQSRCAYGGAFVRYWVHNGYVISGGEKMSKSLGNFFTVHELLEEFPGEVIRLALMSAHYRQPLDMTRDLLRDCRKRLDRWYRLTAEAEAASETPEAVLAALADDLNTPKAIAALAALARPEDAAALLAGARFLGLLEGTAETWFRGGGTGELSAAEIEEKIAARRAARAARDFARADAIRDALAAAGIRLLDRPDGTTDWERTG
ncbi:MAG: cysteine--tRNA ligase [Rhodothalassiaceae bacterium]